MPDESASHVFVVAVAQRFMPTVLRCLARVPGCDKPSATISRTNLKFGMDTFSAGWQSGYWP